MRRLPTTYSLTRGPCTTSLLTIVESTVSLFPTPLDFMRQYCDL